MAEELSLKLELGPTLTIPRHLALRVAMASAARRTNLPATVTLRNGDVLYGRILDETLTMQTRYGAATAQPSDVTELTFTPGLVGPAKMHLRNGTTVTGKFVGRTIDFQITPGPKLPLFVGHVVRIECTPGKAEAKPGGAAASAPPRTTPTQPAVKKAERVRRAPRSTEKWNRFLRQQAHARLKALQAKLASVEKTRAELAAKADPAAKKELKTVTALIDQIRGKIAELKKKAGSP